ncbi:hypothetical protein CDL15_Pgr018559 [Punica granatum]|uniref:Uncharacterized protein n=1 Tax=Punica granatum TaxID=22663 RepID=A0A218X031_PUNGR|nr:hypothetical protein CDL15_Pgr018559 [Punica granatum]
MPVTLAADILAPLPQICGITMPVTLAADILAPLPQICGLGPERSLEQPFSYHDHASTMTITLIAPQPTMSYDPQHGLSAQGESSDMVIV